MVNMKYSKDNLANRLCSPVPSFPLHVGLGCPSKLVSIRNNRNWNRNQFRHYPKKNFCFGCFASIPKQRFLMFRLNRNKQKTNRNSLIWSIFSIFSGNLGFFRFFSVSCFFGNSLFRLFRFYTETESFNVLIEPKQTEEQLNSLIESIFWYFCENLGLFRFVSKHFCLFPLFRYRL